MTSIILPKITNDIEDSEYKKFNSMTEYIESTLNEDKELYKYVSLKDGHSFIKNIVRDNTIKFSSPDEFNDPFECMSVIGVTSFDITMNKLEELTRASGKKYSEKALIRAYDEIVKKSLESYRNNSLSEQKSVTLITPEIGEIIKLRSKPRTDHWWMKYKTNDTIQKIKE